MITFFFEMVLFLTSIFMILLVLVQRGKGGGLAGAFGGMGGQSAFGTKAGDLFTRITIGAAIFWIILCLGAIAYLSSVEPEAAKNMLNVGGEAPAETTDATGTGGNEAATDTEGGTTPATAPSTGAVTPTAPAAPATSATTAPATPAAPATPTETTPAPATPATP